VLKDWSPVWHYWEVVAMIRDGVHWEVFRLLECALERDHRTPFSFFLTFLVLATRWKFFSIIYFSATMYCLAQKQCGQGLKPLRLWTEINLYSLPQVFCYSNGKLTNTCANFAQRSGVIAFLFISSIGVFTHSLLILNAFLIKNIFQSKIKRKQQKPYNFTSQAVSNL
jgi:hypothetical protein